MCSSSRHSGYRSRLRWEAYETLFTAIPFARQMFNTLFVCVVIIAGQLLFSSMGAYAFARLNFPGREFLFLFFLSTMMVPGAVTLIPTFMVIRYFGWVNTYMAIIGPLCAGECVCDLLPQTIYAHNPD